MAASFAGWPELVQQHLRWYPLMEPSDIYKLLYQGVMGAEHLLSSPEAFIQQLLAEFALIPPDPSGRLLEPIRPDRVLLRLNLCAYKSRGYQVSTLLSPLLETGQMPLGNPAVLESVWMRLAAACDQGLVPGIEPGGIRSFTAWLEGAGFPPVHHSQAYRQHYQPAYRLISAQSAHRSGLVDAG